MKMMDIEKQLEFKYKIVEIKKMNAKSNLKYLVEKEGTRAVGELIIDGVYLTDTKQVLPFYEVIEMDVLAPVHKLGEEPFKIELMKYDYEKENNILNIYLQLAIFGIIDKEEKQELNDDEEIDIIEKEDGSTKISADEFEDLFEDEDSTYTSYRLIVAREQDTYETIAQRYHIDENMLRNSNQNKDIEAKSLIILPQIM